MIIIKLLDAKLEKGMVEILNNFENKLPQIRESENSKVFLRFQNPDIYKKKQPEYNLLTEVQTNGPLQKYNKIIKIILFNTLSRVIEIILVNIFTLMHKKTSTWL